MGGVSNDIFSEYIGEKHACPYVSPLATYVLYDNDLCCLVPLFFTA